MSRQRDAVRILVLDGQGGGIGGRLVKGLSARIPAGCELLCVGTNALATNTMLKAGAKQGATGENAVIYNAGRADIILGPLGMLLANGIMGEVTPAMAQAVSGAEAVKILIPSSSCGVRIAGAEGLRLEELLQTALEMTLEEIGRGEKETVTNNG